MSERCRMYDEQISAYLDGELSEAEAARLRAHAAGCEDCADLLDLLSGLSSAMRDDLAEPPPDLADGVMDRIAAWENARYAGQPRPAPAPVPISSARRARHTGRNFAVAACLILAIGAGAYYGMSRSWQESAARNVESITLDAGAALAETEEAEIEKEETEEAVTFGAAPEAAEVPMADAWDTDTRNADAWDADTWGEEPAEEQVTLDNGPALFAAPAEEPAPQAEARSFDDAAPAQAEPESPAWPAEEPMEEAAQKEAAEPEAAADGFVAFTQGTYAAARFTCDHPAHVVAGKEDAFEALLHSSATPGDVDEDELTDVAAVEYNGVIYEFFLDEESDQLLWKDAAESVFPLPADGTEDDLWDIIE